MQRQAFPPAHSPPLHHPVPQHVSTVPQLRSPPPPAQQQQPQGQQQGGYGYAPQGAAPGGGGGWGQPSWGNFVNDGTAQMGIQMLKNAVPGEYMEQNFNRYVNVSALKHYFNVSNSYVVNKLYLVLFPWRHKPWSRQQRPMHSQSDSGPVFLPPRDDINSPDMYIPVMAFVTYVLLSTFFAGLRGAFHPELLGLTASTAVFIVFVELACLKLGAYLLGISSNESQWLDLVAYSGYKFVGCVVTGIVSELVNKGKGTGGMVGWFVFFYTFCANAFFLLRSMKYVLLPDPNAAPGAAPGAGGYSTVAMARPQKNRRTQFLFVYSFLVQLVGMWILTR